MFETAELGREISKHEYNERVPDLRQSLLMAQGRLRSAEFPVIVLFAGVDGAGKGETANRLTEWMDPRWLVTRAFDVPSDEESERPDFWRFWKALPPSGQIGLFLSAWYSGPLLQRVHGASEDHFEAALEDIAAFEKTLADDGALIVKFWMHLGKDQQQDRFKTLEQDPVQAWRVTEQDWEHWRLYDDFVEAAERIIAHTSNGTAPWHIIEGANARYRSLRVGTLLLEAMEERIAEASLADEPAEAPEPQAELSVGSMTILSQLDMSPKLEKSQYGLLLDEQKGRLNVLHRRAHEQKLSTLLVFEGWDASGKGGAIRRLTSALDARHVQVIPVAAPTDEERAHHYLWRFWRHLPRAGRVTIFDRSWYGRVLVERIEGFATDKEWQRAYSEIRQFEQELIGHGVVLVKFWLHITPDEQMDRFKEREKTPHKRWKITDDDWRNRDRWSDYELAVHEMVERTSTRHAPWNLIAANDKRYARIQVLRSVCEALESALARPPE